MEKLVEFHDKHKCFSLTCVFYQKDDLFGFLLAFLTLSPVFITVWYATLIVALRDVRIANMFVGQVANVLLNLILKKLIDHPRPAIEYSVVHDGGMPSNHSQFMAYFATFIFLVATNSNLIHEASKKVESSLNDNFVVNDFIAVTCSLASAALCIMVAISRIYLSLHTANQVYVGLFAGMFYAIFWFYVVTPMLMKSVYSRIVDNKYAKLLGIHCNMKLSALDYLLFEASEDDIKFIENRLKSVKTKKKTATAEDAKKTK